MSSFKIRYQVDCEDASVDFEIKYQMKLGFFGNQQNLQLESLILAQIERWRYA
jgi:hypothetical protein